MEKIMADAYGTITFTKSSDCTLDSAALIDALNSFKWSSDEVSWVLDEEDSRISINSWSPQYPVAIPEFDELIHIKNEDGTWTTHKASDVNEDEIESTYTYTVSPYPLATLSQRLSQHINSGWIEIACVANEKTRYVYFQSLRIHSDGRSSKINTWTGPWVESINEQESYVPSN
jgi:hypothetical protein